MIFLTWQFWQNVQFPMRQHPIFQYGGQSSVAPINASKKRWLGLQITVLAIVILLALIFPVPALITTVLTIVALPTVLILLSGTVLGTIWIIRISTTLSDTRQATRYRLLQLTQLGGLGASWLLAMGIVHRYDWLKRVYKVIKWVLFLIVVLLALSATLLIIGLLTSENVQLQQQQLNVLRDVITLTVIVVALWLDHIQSILVSVLLGLILPTLFNDKVYIRVIAPIVYLTIQALTYLVIAVIYALVNIILIALIGANFVSFSMTLIMTIISFYMMREIILTALLHMILIKYDTSITEFQSVMSRQ